MSDDKIEKSDTPLHAEPSSDYRQQPGYSLKEGGLFVANLALTVATTSVLITAAQSPLKSMAMNLTKTGKFFSDLHKPWSLAAIKSLYSGSASALSSGVARSTYVVGSKGVEPALSAKVATIATKEASTARETTFVGKEAAYETKASLGESHHESVVFGLEQGEPTHSTTASKTPVSLLHRLPGVALVTTGDLLVTQIGETKSQLQKAGIKSEAGVYKWNTIANLKSLSKLGIVSRFSGSMINFTALCIATDFYAQYIPGENQNVKQTLGGMLSGLTAAVVSFPFNYYRDYLMTKVTVSEGNLIAPKTSQVIYDGMQGIKKMSRADLIIQAKPLLFNAAVRALSTGVTFAIVAGVASALGSDPVTRLVDNDLNASPVNPTKKHKDLLEEIKYKESDDAAKPPTIRPKL